MNQEHNNTTPTPKASLLLMEDNLCKRGSEISRSSSVGVSSRLFYYYHHRSLNDGVPFKWEMQPGTPINPPPEEIVPPITPPPAHLSHNKNARHGGSNSCGELERTEKSEDYRSSCSSFSSTSSSSKDRR
ncbi:hypothetical protein Bca4012_045104 [Brassica carinata]